MRPGEPFRDVLWHRLADTEVIVLLDSPQFLDSRWTEEELSNANFTNVQILQLIWPSHSFSAQQQAAGRQKKKRRAASARIRRR